MCHPRAVGALLLLCLISLSPLAIAQKPTGQFARIVVIQPKPDHAEAFAAGYERHLVWHKANKDPWSWHGWTFVLGERLGLFMDGTFGHTIDEFDHAVDPTGDAADNNTNVVPHADFLSHGIYERLEAASSGPLLPDASPYMALHTYIVVPGQEAAFERSITEAAKHPNRQPMSWYKARVGGPVTQYLLVRPAQSFATGGLLADVSIPAGLVQQAKSELLRYQPQMSYTP